MASRMHCIGESRCLCVLLLIEMCGLHVSISNNSTGKAAYRVAIAALASRMPAGHRRAIH